MEGGREGGMEGGRKDMSTLKVPMYIPGVCKSH